MTFDHVGIFVRDIAEGRDKLEAILPTLDWGKVYDDHGMHVRVCFATDPGGLRYELVAPFGSPNPVEGVLAGGRNILNHMAYRVPNMETASERLRQTGAIPISAPQPAVAFAGSLVMFFLTALGFIVELVEDRV